jgi:hypothetical protein
VGATFGAAVGSVCTGVGEGVTTFTVTEAGTVIDTGTVPVTTLLPGRKLLRDATPTRVWLTIVDEIREESGQPASAKVIKPRPVRLDRDPHHLLIRRQHVAFELGKVGFV